MINQRPAILNLLLVYLMVIVVGCAQPTPEPTETPVATQPTTTIVAAPAAAPTATPTMTVTPDLTATATVTPTLEPAAITLLETLNVRSGPGLAYPILGAAAPGDVLVVIGRSPDGIWWQAECPPSINAMQCWVVSDPEFSIAAGSFDVVAVATAPPAPSPTPTPTIAPCMISAPPGWSAYRVRAGDTLFGLSQQAGTSVTQLQTVNCLDTDIIVEGSILYLPAGARTSSSAEMATAASTQPAAPSRPNFTVRTTQVSVNESAVFDVEALTPLLGIVVNPNTSLCTPQSSGQRQVFIGQIDRSEQRAWEVGELVGICLDGFSSQHPIRVTVRSAFAPGWSRTRTIQPGELHRWAWLITPEQPEGDFHVEARQNSSTVSNQFATGKARQKRMFLMDYAVPPGELPTVESETVRIGLAGFSPGAHHLYLCYDDGGAMCYQLSPAPINARGEAILQLSADADVPSNIYTLFDDRADPSVTLVFEWVLQ